MSIARPVTLTRVDSGITFEVEDDGSSKSPATGTRKIGISVIVLKSSVDTAKVAHSPACTCL